MNYLDIIFPDELSDCFSSETTFLTSISTIKNKQEIRNQNWQEPKRKYNLIYKKCSKKTYQKLYAFFLICQGCKNSFNFIDKNDNKIENQQIAIGDSQTINFEIYKTYAYENFSVKKTLYKITNAQVFIDNQEIDKSNYTINDNILTFTNNFIPKTGEIISITCMFYNIVRFENDNISAIRHNNIIELPDISLIEVQK